MPHVAARRLLSSSPSTTPTLSRRLQRAACLLSLPGKQPRAIDASADRQWAASRRSIPITTLAVEDRLEAGVGAICDQSMSRPLPQINGHLQLVSLRPKLASFCCLCAADRKAADKHLKLSFKHSAGQD